MGICPKLHWNQRVAGFKIFLSDWPTAPSIYERNSKYLSCVITLVELTTTLFVCNLLPLPFLAFVKDHQRIFSWWMRYLISYILYLCRCSNPQLITQHTHVYNFISSFNDITISCAANCENTRDSDWSPGSGWGKWQMSPFAHSPCLTSEINSQMLCTALIRTHHIHNGMLLQSVLIF